MCSYTYSILGGESIETTVTADHLRKPEQCFLFECGCSNTTIQTRPLKEGQVDRSHCKCPTMQILLSFNKAHRVTLHCSVGSLSKLRQPL